jgi:hypothetical protein
MDGYVSFIIPRVHAPHAHSLAICRRRDAHVAQKASEKEKRLANQPALAIDSMLSAINSHDAPRSTRWRTF